MLVPNVIELSWNVPETSLFVWLGSAVPAVLKVNAVVVPLVGRLSQLAELFQNLVVSPSQTPAACTAWLESSAAMADEQARNLQDAGRGFMGF
jgi:hypothetical protein